MTDFSPEAVEGGAAELRERAEQQQRRELAAIVSEAERAGVSAEESAEPVEGPDNGELAASVALVVFEVLAARAGDHWRLSDGEAKALGKAAGPVLDKHVGRGALGPEAGLVAVALALVVPRVLMSRAVAVERAAAVPDREQSPRAPGVAPGEAAVMASALVE